MEPKEIEGFLAKLEQCSNYQEGHTLIHELVFEKIGHEVATQIRLRSLKAQDSGKKELLERWAIDAEGAVLLYRILFEISDDETSRGIISNAAPEVVHSALYYNLDGVNALYIVLNESKAAISAMAENGEKLSSNKSKFDEERATYQERFLGAKILLHRADLLSGKTEDNEQKAKVLFWKGVFSILESDSAAFLKEKKDAKMLLSEAKDWFEKALTFSSDFSLQLHCYNNLSEAVCNMDPNESLPYLQALKTEIQKMKPSTNEELEAARDLKVQILGKIYRLYRILDRPQDAYNELREAIDYSEARLFQLYAPFLVEDFLKRNSAAYMEMIEFCLELGEKEPEYNKRALETLEKISSRVFVKYMGTMFGGTEVPPVLGIQREQLLKELQSRGMNATEEDLPEIEKIRYNIGRVEQAILKQSKVKVWDLTRELPPDFNEILARIPENTLLVEYFRTSKCITAFVVSNEGKVDIVKIDPDKLEPRARLEDLILYSNLAISVRKKFAGFDEFQKEFGVPMPGTQLTSLNRLYNLLVKPLTNLLKNKKALIIIPHQELKRVPFQALYREIKGRKRFLVEDFAISYTPAISILPKASEQKQPLRTCFVAGVPKSRGGPRKSMAEARMVANFFETEPFPATKDNLITKAHFNDVIHLSCHSFSDNALTTFRGIKLEDGPLTGKDIASCSIDFNCSLFTLSACSTFEDFNTDQGLGIVGEILHAGAKSVLTSLWPVSSDATFRLMKEFYKNLKVFNKTEALQKAQIEVRRKYSYHPFLWAPFILVGALS